MSLHLKVFFPHYIVFVLFFSVLAMAEAVHGDAHLPGHVICLRIENVSAKVAKGSS